MPYLACRNQEDNAYKRVFSFYHVNPGDETQALRLGVCKAIKKERQTRGQATLPRALVRKSPKEESSRVQQIREHNKPYRAHGVSTYRGGR